MTPLTSWMSSRTSRIWSSRGGRRRRRRRREEGTGRCRYRSRHRPHGSGARARCGGRLAVAPGRNGWRGRRGGQVQEKVVDADAGGAASPSWTGAVPESMRGKAKRDDDLDAMEGGGTPPRRRSEHRSGGSAEKKHRRSDPRVTAMALSLLSCFATMALLYSRLSAKLPPPEQSVACRGKGVVRHDRYERSRDST